MADHCEVHKVFRTMFVQLQEHVLCMKAPSMYGATPTSALGVYKAKILILNGIIKKTDESEFSLIISVEPQGVSCRHPQSLCQCTPLQYREKYRVCLSRCQLKAQPSNACHYSQDKR